jgi:hypothetical protein
MLLVQRFSSVLFSCNDFPLLQYKRWKSLFYHKQRLSYHKLIMMSSEGNIFFY